MGQKSKMGASSPEEEYEFVPQRSRQVCKAAEANSAARAAAVCAQRNLCSGFTDDSDDDLDNIASAAHRASHTKLYGSKDYCAPLKKKRKSEQDLSDADAGPTERKHRMGKRRKYRRSLHTHLELSILNGG
jgi:hypothetical protein